MKRSYRLYHKRLWIDLHFSTTACLIEFWSSWEVRKTAKHHANVADLLSIVKFQAFSSGTVAGHQCNIVENCAMLQILFSLNLTNFPFSFNVRFSFTNLDWEQYGLNCMKFPHSYLPPTFWYANSKVFINRKLLSLCIALIAGTGNNYPRQHRVLKSCTTNIRSVTPTDKNKRVAAVGIEPTP